MVIDDSFYMNLAIQEAWKYFGITYPNPPVGAVVVKNGAILAISSHNKAGFAHAEVNAIKEAYHKLTKDEQILNIDSPNDIHNYLYDNHNRLFEDATIYVTLEPCNHYGKTPPCALLLEKLKFEKVVIAVLEENKEAVGGAKKLQEVGINVVSGVLENEAKALLAIFESTLSNKPFVFFKYAQTLNSKIDGGYISTNQSLLHVHKLRDMCDLLVIGGNTVRVDRPTLDARKINGKAPDVLIYSNSSDFDETIPLFNVPNRKVFVSNSFDLIQNYRFVMIEGGSKMLDSCKNIIDYLLVFISPTCANGGYKIDTNLLLEYKYISKIDIDLLIWAKIIK